MAVWLLIKRLILYPVVDHWRVALPVILASAIVLYVFFHYGCSKPAPKLDQEQIIKNQQAVASQDRQQMQDAYVESKAKEAATDESVGNAKAAAVNAAVDARRDAQQMTNDELANYLNEAANK
jgi:hypothetical protein